MSNRWPPRRTRSSKAIGAALWAPLVEAIANGIVALVNALGTAIAKTLRAARRRRKDDS